METAFVCSPLRNNYRGRRLNNQFNSSTTCCSTRPSEPLPSSPIDEKSQSIQTSTQVGQEKSALDDVPRSLKLNAVAAAVAQRKDHASTLRLLSEMATLGIPLDSATQTSIVNASVTNHTHLASLLSQLQLAGYNSITDENLNAASENKNTEKSKQVIDPEKPLEMSVASVFMGVVSTSLSAEVIEPTFLHHSADEATAALMSICLILVADRYALSGVLWKKLQKGLVRIMSRDISRIARLDAACFLIGYIVGVPWLCYRVDGKKAAQWLNNMNTADNNDNQVKMNVVDKCLIWLVAGVALELQEDGTLILSNLGAAREFMRQVRRMGATEFNEDNTKEKPLSVKQCDDKIETALVTSKALLKQYEELHLLLTDAILGRTASVGDCVSLLSNRFSSGFKENGSTVK